MLCQLSYSRGAPGARRSGTAAGARGLREGHEGWRDGRRAGAKGRWRRRGRSAVRKRRVSGGARAVGTRAVGGGGGRRWTGQAVERGGFEPPKADAGRFTACCVWPLRYHSDTAAPRLTEVSRRAEAGGSSRMRNREPSFGMTIARGFRGRADRWPAPDQPARVRPVAPAPGSVHARAPKRRHPKSDLNPGLAKGLEPLTG